MGKKKYIKPTIEKIALFDSKFGIDMSGKKQGSGFFFSKSQILGLNKNG